MSKAVIGIGTNMGDRKMNIQNAIEALKKVPMIEVIREAALFETKPWGFTEQQNFYNTVVEVETEFTPSALLGVCLGVEAGFGRIREFKNGPRIIDLDLLFFEGVTSDTKELKLPHPYIGERDFVLVPLQELFPDMNIYGWDYFDDYQLNYKPENIHIV